MESQERCYALKGLCGNDSKCGRDPLIKTGNKPFTIQLSPHPCDMLVLGIPTLLCLVITCVVINTVVFYGDPYGDCWIETIIAAVILLVLVITIPLFFIGRRYLIIDTNNDEMVYARSGCCFCVYREINKWDLSKLSFRTALHGKVYLPQSKNPKALFVLQAMISNASTSYQFVDILRASGVDKDELNKYRGKLEEWLNEIANDCDLELIWTHPVDGPWNMAFHLKHMEMQDNEDYDLVCNAYKKNEQMLDDYIHSLVEECKGNYVDAELDDFAKLKIVDDLTSMIVEKSKEIMYGKDLSIT